MDTCGFPKDLFYYYQANWTLKPVLHVFPHWNWTTGQLINVWAYGNCDAVELFTNGVSLGQQTLSVTNHVEWDNVSYAPGTLQAVGYRNGQPVMTNTVQTTGTPAKIALWPDRRTILADGRDVSVVTVAVLDSSNRVVPIATNLVNFTITGGAIIGVGNGDPSCHQADKASNQRSVFNGYAQVIVQSANQTGSITLTATSTGLTSTNIIITAAATLPPPDAPTGVVAMSADGQITVTWDVTPGATGYNLKRATTSSGPYTVIVTNTGALGYTDTNITPLTTYYYVVSAVNSAGEGSNSAEINATWNASVTVTATVVSSQVQLNWNARPGVTGYNVKRSLFSGGPYTTIAGNLVTTTYTDASVSTCQTYYYVVTMMVGSTEGPPSPEVAVPVTGPLPSSLTSADIGSVGAAGSAGYCTGQYFVDGAGTDIWNTVDAFQFVYVPMNGDGEIRARVVSVENTDPSAKGGVMIRETLAVGSRHVLVDMKAGGGLETIRRTGTDAYSSVSTTNGSVPYWVRLTRTGTSFQAYYSADGNSWTNFGTARTISMGTSAYAGLAVCSHSYGVLCSAVFDNVYISSMPANTAPVLNPISNVTTNVGGVVTNTAVASDAELSSQTLTFSLLSGPASATLNKINSTNAAFSWRPQVTDANTTNLITLKVADNGSPIMSATQSFSVKVNPLPAPSVSSATFNNGQLTLRVTNSLIGPDYGVLVSSNLVDWRILATNSPTMNYFQWTDPNAATLPARFYRIKVGPPLP
jgi:fibronectin type 3 domain-containing protein